MVKNPHRSGPLTMEKREWGLSQVLEIQAEINTRALVEGRPQISLINSEELARIRELMNANTWPKGWTGHEHTGAEQIDRVIAEGVIQPLLRSEQ